MTTKTLGQVLYEHGGEGAACDIKWCDLDEVERATLQSMAQAVAAVVRDHVAAWVATQRNDVPATGEEFAAAIRSMK